MTGPDKESDPKPDVLMKILRAAEAADLVGTGTFHGSGDDRADGFIHLSTEAQVEGTLRKHFVGEMPLFLAICSTAAFGEDVRWEPSRGGALFPHLYRDLTVEDVLALVPLPEGGSDVRIPSLTT